MGQVLTETEWHAELLDYAHTAFRLELQPAYREPTEDHLERRFLSGTPQSPDELPDFREWFDAVAERTARGARMSRVRVHGDPPTPNQRYLRWLDPWNTRAGEHIRYMTRQHAFDVGLLPAAGDDDWWLLDSSRLLVMRFDNEGHRIQNELVTDPVRVVRACAWRDVAVHHSTPLHRGVAAA